MNRLVAIVGPTAVGKSALALVLAGRFDGEIVSADSRQVYRDLNVGTAKPTRQEIDSIPHHLIDVADPSEIFTLAQYLERAHQAIVDIQSRNCLPLLVGGSGLYIKAILKGMKPPQVSPDQNLRRELEQRASREGGEALHRELTEVDPEAAANIDPRNVRRTIRALEVWLQTGSRFSEAGSESPPPYRSLIIGLTTSRSDLYRRIDGRVDKMMESGLLQEVEALLGKGVSLERPAMSGLGYRQIAEHLSGTVDLATAVQKIKTQTHRFARQQYTWFRLDDEQIRWFDIRDESYERGMEDLLSAWLRDDEP